MPFTADNFSLLMSVLVENKFAREKTPKDILFQFIDAFGKQAVQSKKIPEITHVLFDAWNRGEILVASRDSEVQAFLTSIQSPLPWNTNTPNWIYPVFTSVSGNKSDRYIDRNITTRTQHIQGCTYENTVTLTLKHNYDDADRTLLENIMDTFGLVDTGERNKMRFIQ